MRKKIVSAVASFEALERYRSDSLIEWAKASLEWHIQRQEDLWRQALDLISSAEEFDNSLTHREFIGYGLLELKVLQLHSRMLPLDLSIYEQRLGRSDIHLMSTFYPLAVRFDYRSSYTVSPEPFFWRQMARHLDK
jgi:hypothetical protein